MRQCGECTLCCTLLPVNTLGKQAGVRCDHAKFKKGCTVYRTRRMPGECYVWNCRWLVGDDMADQSRPDRSRLVVDIMPDFVTLQDNETGELTKVQVVQVWCDPNHRDAHRDPAFRRYLARRGAEGIAAIIRYSSSDSLTLFPPNIASDHQWHEIADGISEERTAEQMAEFMSGAKIAVTED